jgi:UDP-N-acetylmuramoylalanine--D-glutamate ligase
MADTGNLKGRSFAVWGLGKTGLATAKHLLTQQADVTIIERGSPSPDTIKQLGPHTQWYCQGEEPEDFSLFETILLSPGVPYDAPGLQRARAAGIPTIASLQWAAWQTNQPTVAVTGSAGKSTTVTLIGDMLRASGLSTFVGGNLGTPLVTLLSENQSVERIVLECSSFQLEACPSFTPTVSVLTNLAPNHLDRHETIEQYAACKAQQFVNLPSDSWAITNAQDPPSASVVQGTKAQQLAFGHPLDDITETQPAGAWLDGDKLFLRHDNWGTESYDLTGFSLPGFHNRENAMAAALAARLVGATPEGMQQALNGFASLAHRLESVGFVDGVHYINDSKATTPDSSRNAVLAFAHSGEPIHLLLGGRSKGSSFAPLVDHLTTQVKGIYLFGEAAQEIAGYMGEKEYELAPTLDDALQQASQAATAGDVVLLSPGCASFDQFQNFEKRGDHFKQWVQDKQRQSATSTTDKGEV